VLRPGRHLEPLHWPIMASFRTEAASPACDEFGQGNVRYNPHVAFARHSLQQWASHSVFGLAIGYETSALRRLSTP